MNRLHSELLRPLALTLLSAGCLALALPASAATDPATPEAATAEPAVPLMRLGNAVKPLSYRVELELSPQQEQFKGQVEIEIELKEARNFFWLNGRGLQIDSAVLLRDGREYAATARYGGKEFIGLGFAEKLPVGSARLRLNYRACGRSGGGQQYAVAATDHAGRWACAQYL